MTNAIIKIFLKGAAVFLLATIHPVAGILAGAGLAGWEIGNVVAR